MADPATTRDALPTHPWYDASVRRIATDRAAQRAVADFLRPKGPTLRPLYAVLGVVRWLERDAARPAACVVDVRALYPRDVDIACALGDAAHHLRLARRERLIELVSTGWYRLTPLGHAVVDALPDADAVRALRGSSGASCCVRPPPGRRK